MSARAGNFSAENGGKVLGATAHAVRDSGRCENSPALQRRDRSVKNISKSVKRTTEICNQLSASEILSPASRALLYWLTADRALKRWAIFISSASRTIRLPLDVLAQPMRPLSYDTPRISWKSVAPDRAPVWPSPLRRGNPHSCGETPAGWS